MRLYWRITQEISLKDIDGSRIFQVGASTSKVRAPSGNFVISDIPSILCQISTRKIPLATSALMKPYLLITVRNFVRQGNIFTSVCQEFCPQGRCLPQCMLGYTPPSRQTTPSPGRHPPQADTPSPTLGRHPSQADTPSPGIHPWQTPPWADTPQADTPWSDTPPGQTHP